MTRRFFTRDPEKHVPEDAKEMRTQAEQALRESEERKEVARSLWVELARIRERNNIALAINARWKK